MVQITKISQQKKEERYNIFVDGRYAFSVSKFNLVKYKLKLGQEVSRDTIDEITALEKLSYYLDCVLRILSVRPRSQKEISQHLQKKIAQKESIKISEASTSPVIGKVMQWLKKYDYLDDLAFTKWYLESRSKRTKSVRLIKQELKMKGISGDILENIKISSTDELKKAINAVEKKVARWQNLDKTDFKKKFFQYLISRGFDYEMIKDAFAFFAKKS